MKPCGNCVPCRNLKIADVELDIKLKNPKYDRPLSSLWSKKIKKSEIKEEALTDKAIDTIIDVVRKDTRNEDLQELPTEPGDEEKESEHQENSERGDQVVLESRKSEI
jgi:hypothetical protein